MKKIYTFSQSLMNGTITMKSKTAAFTSKELAEKTKQAVIEANRENDLQGMTCYYGEIEETDVYENENEIPILNR